MIPRLVVKRIVDLQSSLETRSLLLNTSDSSWRDDAMIKNMRETQEEGWRHESKS